MSTGGYVIDKEVGLSIDGYVIDKELELSNTSADLTLITIHTNSNKCVKC